MKALYIYDQKDGALVLYGHDLTDQLVATLVVEFQAQGKHAFAVDQVGSHGGPAEICDKCRHAGEKIAGGTLTSYQFSEEEELTGSLNGAIGMISSEVAAPASPLSRLSKPIRMLFNLLPYLAALALIGYGLVYFLHNSPEQNEQSLDLPLAQAQLTPTQTLPTLMQTPVPTSTPIPSPSPTSIATPAEVVLFPTETPLAEVVPGCVDVLSITSDDSGKNLCVTGEVYASQEKNGVFSITFTKEWGNFYLLSYDRVWKDAQPGVCIQVTGDIVMSGTIPVIVFGWQNDLSVCP
jgi:hypothetical protein